MKIGKRFLISLIGLFIGTMVFTYDRMHKQAKTIQSLQTDTKRMRKDSVAANRIYLLQNSKLKACDTLHDNCIRIY